MRVLFMECAETSTNKFLTAKLWWICNIIIQHTLYNITALPKQIPKLYSKEIEGNFSFLQNESRTDMTVFVISIYLIVIFTTTPRPLHYHLVGLLERLRYVGNKFISSRSTLLPKMAWYNKYKLMTHTFSSKSCFSYFSTSILVDLLLKNWKKKEKELIKSQIGCALALANFGFCQSSGPMAME